MMLKNIDTNRNIQKAGNNPLKEEAHRRKSLTTSLKNLGIATFGFWVRSLDSTSSKHESKKIILVVSKASMKLLKLSFLDTGELLCEIM